MVIARDGSDEWPVVVLVGGTLREGVGDPVAAQLTGRVTAMRTDRVAGGDDRDRAPTPLRRQVAELER